MKIIDFRKLKEKENKINESCGNGFKLDVSHYITLNRVALEKRIIISDKYYLSCIISFKQVSFYPNTFVPFLKVRLFEKRIDLSISKGDGEYKYFEEMKSKTRKTDVLTELTKHITNEDIEVLTIKLTGKTINEIMKSK